jgi:hypothetical protein
MHTAQHSTAHPYLEVPAAGLAAVILCSLGLGVRALKLDVCKALELAAFTVCGHADAHDAAALTKHLSEAGLGCVLTLCGRKGGREGAGEGMTTQHGSRSGGVSSEFQLGRRDIGTQD